MKSEIVLANIMVSLFVNFSLTLFKREGGGKCRTALNYKLMKIKKKKKTKTKIK